MFVHAFTNSFNKTCLAMKLNCIVKWRKQRGAGVHAPPPLPLVFRASEGRCVRLSPRFHSHNICQWNIKRFFTSIVLVICCLGYYNM